MSVELIVSQFSGDLFRGRRILVTGGAGFLGSWLCEALIMLGAHVSCLDNLSTGRVENIMHLKKYGNFKFIKADISEYHPEGFDFIVHGASLPSPDDYMRRPVETYASKQPWIVELP